ncbi:MAG: fatty acyl-AMP ligase [bacterium]|nr:fatty acyl-AMP ligase [bacterium]
MPTPRFATLIEMLEARARHAGGRSAFRFGGRDYTFAKVWESAERFAGCLMEHGLRPGDRAVLVLPNGAEFFTAFYGAQRAGVVAVPIFPGSGAERVLALADLCGARAIVVASGASASMRERLAGQTPAANLTVLEVADSDGCSSEAGFPGVEHGDLCYIQYTSGSTGDPKGVRITHAMALANVEQLIAGMAITADEVFVSWLPVHHDMGLVLKTMVPFFLGARLVLLPASLTHVRRWLEAIERHRATFTAAPDFAYRLCLRRIKNPADFDLSSLRVALNAAEPVRRRTVEDFHAAFGLEGVMVPGYGLAEATVGVSMWPPGTPIEVDDRGFVSVGRAFPEIDVAIVRDGERVSVGEVGEIVIRGPANTAGYYRNPRATGELFWRDEFLRTGDLGYLDADRDLFVVGREKNIIIHGGRNVAPREVEEIVDRVPFVRRSAAVGIDRGRLEGEQVYVFAEVRGKPAEDELRAMAVGIVRDVHGALGFRPGRVVLVRPRAIPLTDNGKLRHRALRERYLDASLRQQGRILFPDY